MGCIPMYGVWVINRRMRVIVWCVWLMGRKMSCEGGSVSREMSLVRESAWITDFVYGTGWVVRKQKL